MAIVVVVLSPHDSGAWSWGFTLEGRDELHDLAKVRGSVALAGPHWWSQRVTAVARSPYFCCSINHILVGAQQDVVQAGWLPFGCGAAILLCVALFHHLQLGMQVISEDYIHVEWLKIASVMLIKFLAVALLLASIFAILKVAFLG